MFSSVLLSLNASKLPFTENIYDIENLYSSILKFTVSWFWLLFFFWRSMCLVGWVGVFPPPQYHLWALRHSLMFFLCWTLTEFKLNGSVHQATLIYSNRINLQLNICMIVTNSVLRSLILMRLLHSRCINVCLLMEKHFSNVEVLKQFKIHYDK